MSVVTILSDKLEQLFGQIARATESNSQKTGEIVRILSQMAENQRAGPVGGQGTAPLTEAQLEAFLTECGISATEGSTRDFQLLLHFKRWLVRAGYLGPMIGRDLIGEFSRDLIARAKEEADEYRSDV